MTNTDTFTMMFDNPRHRLLVAILLAVAALFALVNLAMEFSGRGDAAVHKVGLDGYLYQATQGNSPESFLVAKETAVGALQLRDRFKTAMHGEHWLWFAPNKIDEGLAILQIDLAWLDHVSIYYFSNEGQYTTYEAGDEHPFNQRVIEFRKPAFPLIREIAGNKVETIALRVSAQGRFSLPLMALSEKAFNLQANLDYLYYGAWMAILISLGFYNATMFFSLRSNVHLYYSTYVLVFTALLIIASGIGQQYIWPHSRNTTTLLANISLALTNYGTVFFTIHFIRLDDYSHKLTTGLKWLAYISLTCIPLVFAFGYGALTAILLCSFIIITLIFPAAVYAAMKGNEVAPFLVASLVVLLPCNTIGLIRFMGFLDNLRWTEHIPELGLVADALILSLALGYKVNLLRTEKDKLTQERETERVAYAKQLIHAKEEERKAIGKALHDDLGHKVLSIKNAVQSIAQQEHSSRQSNAIALIDEAIKDVRDLSHLLYPSIIEHIGLEKAISSVVSKGLYNQDVEFTVNIPSLVLDNELELLLYRAAQEFVNNIVKHSNASEFSLKISTTNDVHKVVMTATDNGDTFFTKEDYGFGLNMLQQQAVLFGGDLLVHRTDDGLNQLTLNIFVNK